MTTPIGRWRITWMETWDQDFVDLIEPGHFRFDDNGLGYFIFGAVEGQLDYRLSEEGKRIDFTWSVSGIMALSSGAKLGSGIWAR